MWKLCGTKLVKNLQAKVQIFWEREELEERELPLTSSASGSPTEMRRRTRALCRPRAPPLMSSFVQLTRRSSQLITRFASRTMATASTPEARLVELKLCVVYLSLHPIPLSQIQSFFH
jgi:hypothetical protein